jgi:hypothetical protein
MSIGLGFAGTVEKYTMLHSSDTAGYRNALYLGIGKDLRTGMNISLPMHCSKIVDITLLLDFAPIDFINPINNINQQK